MLCKSLGLSESGHLTLAGFDTVELAKKYGTPLYLLDTDSVSENFAKLKALAKKRLGRGSRVLYASKALSCLGIYRMAASAGLGIDVVSCGEIYTALRAGFPVRNAYFHGNNKTDEDIAFAMEHGVGCFVADNLEELSALQSEAERRGIKQRVMLRVSPGVDPHTHKAVTTGLVDSKFGAAIETGQALEAVKLLLRCKNLEFEGLHSHIGSQIFEYEPFAQAAFRLMQFASEIKKETKAEVGAVNLGGGFGVRYAEDDPLFDVDKALSSMNGAIEMSCLKYGLRKPDVYIEPGRSAVAAAGMTLYTVGSFKTIRGRKTYVSVDGGMTDNPRYALYGSKYTCLVANRAGGERTERVTIAGRCCESGDLIQEDVMLQPCSRGDILAVLTTGAYNYSMASNYNRLPRPALVAVGREGDRLMIKRESFEDLVRNDL